jgi:uncharacterized protein YceK
MKLLLLLFTIVILSGCGASVHTDNRAVIAVPPAKVTVTTTVTKKVDQPVPVYQTQTSLTSQTTTKTSDGMPSAPLHDATVKSLPDLTRPNSN